ncbi:MAG TPA: ParB/RepB/Spo0J family partition protein [Patescibacteria group bacterium]|jgi:ParB family chromosome partitioning protein|nr:ParB/RepB/Spo0J family partition protein [Patescibacteria group bacterium]
MKRQALGKGLGTLLPEKRPGPIADAFVHLDVSRVVPNPNQPRQSFDESELEDLAASVRTAGILQPILVRQTTSGEYELIAGERRLRAARMAGLQTVPAMVQQVEQQRSLELALIENIQRQQLNPIEEARAFAALASDHGLTQEAVAERVGRKRSSIANSIRLLKLPEVVQEMIRDGRLTPGHAKALLSLADDEEILKTAEAMLQGYVTVRGAEEMAREKQTVAAPVDPNVRDAEQRLQRALGTKVRIKHRGAGKGRIEIDFYSEEELERLFELFVGN